MLQDRPKDIIDGLVKAKPKKKYFRFSSKLMTICIDSRDKPRFPNLTDF